MEDIICPECGRPNLSEAKKCWYCQTELANLTENAPEDTTNKSIEKITSEIESLTDPAKEEEQEIPDWLAKIRKKIEEERGPEEELPYWKQKDIFGGERKIEPKKNKEKRGHKPAQPTDHQDQDQNRTQIEQDQPANQNSDTDIDLEELSDDLPEGFTKI